MDEMAALSCNLDLTGCGSNIEKFDWDTWVSNTYPDDVADIGSDVSGEVNTVDLGLIARITAQVKESVLNDLKSNRLSVPAPDKKRIDSPEALSTMDPYSTSLIVEQVKRAVLDEIKRNGTNNTAMGQAQSDPPQLSPQVINTAFQGFSSESSIKSSRQTRTKFSLEAITALDAWLKEHADYPYPSKSTKEALASQSGLTVKQSFSRCAFCLHLNPEENHLNSCHRIPECRIKPADQYTFFRKDNLKQHVENFHGVEFQPGVADLWREEIDYSGQIWTCGFCGQNLDNWEERANYIAAHFRQGLDMNSWVYPKSNSGSGALGRGNFDSDNETIPRSGTPSPLLQPQILPDDSLDKASLNLNGQGSVEIR
ncbi:hypothetical protein K469DRAFT_747433 [Zopfia rhizophila CBS 207.26]|uniref:KN homeodomain domain-containing protein n=1 Tax=Zopfia rhizophila CBS 207.26 TaxID=1314779 RepID=A0A6A6EJ97_9PEZI|nr:hypothetical protein K469DRAFT_747433 [Zopfia rhizophila CBS 207.26]